MRAIKPISPATTINLNNPFPVEDLLLQDTGYGRRPVMVEIRFGKGGGCSLLINGDKVATAGGYGYDKAGTCLAQWFTKAYQEELKAIFDQPKYQKQLKGSGRGPHPWYCTSRSETTGRISINGMSGRSNVEGIMARSVGLTLRYIGETHESTIYLLARSAAPRKKRAK